MFGFVAGNSQPTVKQITEGIYTEYESLCYEEVDTPGSGSSIVLDAFDLGRQVVGDYGWADDISSFTATSSHSSLALSTPFDLAAKTTVLWLHHAPSNNSTVGSISSTQVNGSAVSATQDFAVATGSGSDYHKTLAYSHILANRPENVISTSAVASNPYTDRYPQILHMFILPGKWEAIDSFTTGSQTMQPGDIIVGTSGSSAYDVSGVSGWVSDRVSTTAPMLYERGIQWYNVGVSAAWVNNTSSNISFEYTAGVDTLGYTITNAKFFRYRCSGSQ